MLVWFQASRGEGVVMDLRVFALAVATILMLQVLLNTE